MMVYSKLFTFVKNGNGSKSLFVFFAITIFVSHVYSAEENSDFLLNSALNGDAKAQYLLGREMYDKEYLNKNYKDASDWFRRSAEQQNIDAQFMLGVVYQEGNEEMRDYSEAYYWFKLVADRIRARGEISDSPGGEESTDLVTGLETEQGNSALYGAAGPEPEQSDPALDGAIYFAVGGQGELDKNPVPLRRPSPQYPDALRRDRVNGKVLVEIGIDERGRVGETEIVNSSDEAFSKSSLPAVRRWKFEPAERDGEKVESKARQQFDFNIKK